ncbi:PIF1 helicase [Striga hermonthica]|uniref:ATP-dependent DNA helicase n=1 Tax=Striga hermonthica TaxID=68872 RepID=A0A9N7MWT0_STRHE|nr:PIF1 helicase [Striga hermonthica]
MGAVDPSNSNKPFGGKTIVFGGDFRQILPVIPKGSHQDIVNAIINTSSIWKDSIVLRLTKYMLLQNISDSDERDELASFVDWIASIRDGTLGGSNDGCASIDILDDIILDPSDDPVATIMESIYPMFKNSTEDPSYLKDKVILAPSLEVVECISQYMSEMNSADVHTYLSSDSASKSDFDNDFLADLHTPEFFNSIKCSGTSKHELTQIAATELVKAVIFTSHLTTPEAGETLIPMRTTQS